MRAIFTTLAFFLFFDAAASAQEEATTPTATVTPAPAPTKTRRTSAERRKELQATIGATPFLFMFSPDAFGFTPIYGGMFLDADLAVEGQATFATSGGGKNEVAQQVIYFKKYFGNSFFVNVGMGQRTIVNDLKYEDEFGFGSFRGPEVKITTHTLGSFVGLGHRWQFSTFTMGFDYCSFYIPMVLMAKKRDTYGNDADPSKVETLEEESVGKAKDVGVILPQLFVGVSF